MQFISSAISTEKTVELEILGSINITVMVLAADGMDEQFSKQMRKGSHRAGTGGETGKKRGKRMRRHRGKPGGDQIPNNEFH